MKKSEEASWFKNFKPKNWSLDFELLSHTLNLKIILMYTEINLIMKKFFIQKRRCGILSSTCFVAKLFLVSKIKILTSFHIRKTRVLNMSEKVYWSKFKEKSYWRRLWINAVELISLVWSDIYSEIFVLSTTISTVSLGSSF